MTGEKKKHEGKPTPIEIESYMKNIKFPAKKNDLISQAKENSAPEAVMDILNQFSDKEYNSPVDISKEAAK